MTNAKAAWCRRIARAVLQALLAFGLAVGLCAQPAFADVQYVYDEIGRLIQVIDQNGDSARYVYDAAGNITRIRRVSSGTLAVTGFTPMSGPTGTSVTVYGSGFSATPANNTVQFNGAAATVTAASANQLVATVPSGATTGTIAVTVGGNTATSAESFTVTTGSGGAPTITGFTPGGGAPGTAVTITGTNFDPVMANNVVRFNDAAQAALSSATASEITATVPNYAGSGPISVRTPQGSASSADDFIVTPAGYAYADIVARSRVTIDGATGSLGIAAASKHGIVLFEGKAGDFLSLQINSLSVSPSGSVAYKVFNTKNVQIASGNVSGTAMSVHLPELTGAGTYSIFFSPGAATANLTFALTRNAVLSASQPTINSNVAVAGQSTRLVFPGTSGTSASFRLGVASTTPTNQSVSMTIYKDALQIATASGSSSNDGAVIPPFSLPVTGNYFVVIAPANAATGSVSVTLNPSIDLVIDGAPLALSASTVGSGKRVLFSGTAGQSIGVALTGLTYSPSSTSGTSVSVYNPDGTLLNTTSNNCTPGNPNGGCTTALAPLNLPSTGVYQITIVPPSNVTFTGTLTASLPFYSLLDSGISVPVEITRPGQHAAFNFTGAVGQALTLRLTIAGTTPANQTLTMSLWGPTGLVGSRTGTSGSDGLTLDVGSLPANGQYGVIVVPSYGATASMALTLNPSMDMAIDGAPLTVSTTVPGYTKRLLFSGTAGQSVGVALTGLAYSPSGSSSGTTVNVVKPDGNTLVSTSSTCVPSNPNGGCSNFVIAHLPTTGTYQITITPPSNVSFSGTVTLSTPVRGVLSSGTAFSFDITRAGQYGSFNFTGTAGQALTVRLAEISTTPANQTVTMTLWYPNGASSSVTGSTSSDGMTLSVSNLTQTGTYGLTITPKYQSTGSMTITVNPPMDFAIDAATLAVSTSVPGYQKRVTFSATAGQQIGLALTGLTYSPSSSSGTNLAIYKPDGNQLASTGGCNPSNPGGGCSFGSLTLPTTGTYQVVITPPSNVTFSGTLTASSPVWISTLTSGSPSSIEITRAGQWGGGGFSGTVGQSVTLRLDVSSTTPANQTVTMKVWGASGQVGPTVTATQGSGGTIWNATLPSTGSYSAIVTVGFGATGSVTLTLNPTP